MSLHIFTITPPINVDRLQEDLIAAVGGAFIRIDNGGPDAIGVWMTDNASQQQVTSAQTVCANHNGSLLSTVQQKAINDNLNLADIQARWKASALHNDTPAQIYTAMQAQIDGWASLAAAKADLRVWLPAIFAALAWTIMKDQQRD